MCLAQGPQRSDVSEAWTRGLSLSSQLALYHWATALPIHTLDNKFLKQASALTAPGSW